MQFILITKHKHMYINSRIIQKSFFSSFFPLNTIQLGYWTDRYITLINYREFSNKISFESVQYGTKWIILVICRWLSTDYSCKHRFQMGPTERNLPLNCHITCFVFKRKLIINPTVLVPISRYEISWLVVWNIYANFFP
jgi:hypothetical protein